MYPAAAVINYIIELSQKHKKPTTHLKAQLIMFLCHALYAGKTKTRLVTEDVYAFPFGPVIPDLWDRLCIFGKADLMKPIAGVEQVIDVESEAGTCIRSVFRHLQNASLQHLVNLTTSDGGPWYNLAVAQDTMDSRIIPFAEIVNFYATIASTNPYHTTTNIPPCVSQ